LEEAIKQEKQRAEKAQKQLRTEKQRAEEERQRAEEAHKELRTEKQRAETEKQQRLIAAKAMKNDGMPIEQIARYLNLTPDELAQL
jgi:hypothetical protein